MPSRFNFIIGSFQSGTFIRVSNSHTLLALTQPIIAILIALVLGSIGRLDQRQRYFHSFAAAFFLFGVGLAMQIGMLPRNLLINANLAGLSFLTAALFFCHGLVRLADGEFKWHFFLTAAVLSSLLRAYFTLTHWDPKIRIYLLHFTVMVMLLAAIWEIRHLRKERVHERVLFWTSLIFALSFLPRTLVTLGYAKTDYGYDGSWYWVFVQVVFYVFGVIFALLLLITAAHRALHLIIKNSHLDPLTQINNREGFQKHVGARITRGECYSLVMLDIDHFKSINDQYGHSIGDQALVQVAEVLQKNAGPQSIAGRIGGEEFMVFLHDTPLTEALRIAQQLRTLVAQITLDELPDVPLCTASFGVATFERGFPIEQAYPKVDALLYQAKENGRNCVWAATHCIAAS